MEKEQKMKAKIIFRKNYDELCLKYYKLLKFLRKDLKKEEIVKKNQYFQNQLILNKLRKDWKTIIYVYFLCNVFKQKLTVIKIKLFNLS